MAKFEMELDDNFISKLFELTDACPPSGEELNLQALKKQLYELGKLLDEQKHELDELRVKAGKRAKREEREQKEQSSSNFTFTPTQKTVEEKSNAISPEDEMFEKFKMSPEADVQANTASSTNIPVPISYSAPSLVFVEQSEINHKDREFYDDDGKLAKGRVLIIDDLGVVTYQLSVLFKRAGYLPVTSREIYDAVDQFKRAYYDYVIMDLFIPTEREGFILLEELKKIATMRKDSTIIGVMSASSRKEHKITCQKHGAAFYVEKIDDWQKELFKIIMQYAS